MIYWLALHGLLERHFGHLQRLYVQFSLPFSPAGPNQGELLLHFPFLSVHVVILGLVVVSENSLIFPFSFIESAIATA